MVFGIAFLLLPFADCLLQKAQAATISDIGEEMDPPPSVPAQEQPEVLTRGPVHEAFAEPVSLQADDGLVTSKQPPARIEEIPQREKPAGGNFVWVPGYWSWDGERNNYIWVSGCWRIAPPKMSWVSGYWTRVSVGWKWVSGFWMQSGNNEIEYLKAPPATVEIEPVGTPPAPECIWVPGCWYWSQDRYVSRPGYWLQGHTGWVWIPSHYVWTPRGYVFSSGHWDYSLERRGVLFAPVYFPSSVVYTRPGFRYSLGVTVDLGLLKVNLFCSPRYSHYYFGDYYDDAYIRIGIFPCFESVRRHTWYDPIYQYGRWHSRDSRWDEHEKSSYELRRNDRNLRPARTYREQETRLSKLTEGQRNNFQITRTVSAVSPSKSASGRIEQTDNNTRQKIIKQSNDVQNYREERRRWESPNTSSKAAQPSEVRVKDANPKAKSQSTVERIKDESSRSPQSSETPAVSAKQSERIKDTSYRSTQKTANRNESSAQSDRIKDATPRNVQSTVDRNDSPGRSERVRVPDSPVSDRVSSYTSGDRIPSAPTEERRSQDDTRDSRRDDGQRGGGNRGR
jgi:hypothetical protein